MASSTDPSAPSAGMAVTEKGLFMTQTYNDAATPVNFGNIINLLGQGSGQLLCEWTGTDSSSGHLYYRSHRDTSTGGWGSWRKIIDDGNYTSYTVKKDGTGATGNNWAIGITGNAATATKATSADKLTNARKIILGGDTTGSVSFNGSTDVTINGRRRGCMVGHSKSTVTTNWYKFASCEMTTQYLDNWISFKVTEGYADSLTCSGILTAHIRRESDSSTVTQPLLRWEYVNAGITLSDFALVYKAEAANKPLIVELWVNIPYGYRCVHFDVIAEGRRNERQTNIWTLYDKYEENGDGTSLPSGYTHVTSTVNRLIHHIESNNDAVINLTAMSNSSFSSSQSSLPNGSVVAVW